MKSEDQQRRELDAELQAKEARTQLAHPARPLYDVGYPMREMANRNRLQSQPITELPDWQRLGYPSEAYYQQHIQKRVETAKTTASDLEKAKTTADNSHDILVKVMLWGNDALKPRGESGAMKTMGVDFISITIDRCKLQLWDTAGQSRFKFVPGAMFRGARVVVLFAQDEAEFTDLRTGIDSQKLIDDNVITILAKPGNVQINTADYPICGVINLDVQPGKPNMAGDAFAKIVHTMITQLAGPLLQRLKAEASVAAAPAPAAASSSATSNPDSSGSGNCCVM